MLVIIVVGVQSFCDGGLRCILMYLSPVDYFPGLLFLEFNYRILVFIFYILSSYVSSS